MGFGGAGSTTKVVAKWTAICKELHIREKIHL